VPAGIAGRRHGHGGSQRIAGLCCDAREYEFPAKILKKLGATRIRLLSNNRQNKTTRIGRHPRGRASSRQPRLSKISRAYLQTKKRKMGHLLEGV
jgi:GTP cyclohydrolase II